MTGHFFCHEGLFVKYVDPAVFFIVGIKYFPVYAPDGNSYRVAFIYSGSEIAYKDKHVVKIFSFSCKSQDSVSGVIADPFKPV